MKTAVVTGASSGIGLAICERLLDEGYQVFGISRMRPRLRHDNFTFQKCDLADPMDIQRLFALINFDDVHLLVNNAGTSVRKPAVDFSEYEYNRIFDVNFKAPALLAKLLFSKIRDGMIINIASDLSILPVEGYSIYSASKAALTMFFKVYAREYSDIKVINLLPSMVDTPLLRKLRGESFQNWRDIIQPDDVAELISSIQTKPEDFESGSDILITTKWLEKDLRDLKEPIIYHADTKTFTGLKGH